VGIGWFRRKLEENFVGRSEVGQVGNFTDFTDQPFIPTPTLSVRFRSIKSVWAWAENLYWAYWLGRNLVLDLAKVSRSRLKKSAKVGRTRPNSLIVDMSKQRRFDSRPKSVMSGRCQSKTNFFQILTAYRTDIV
jgi:hypothetical protein